MFFKHAGPFFWGDTTWRQLQTMMNWWNECVNLVQGWLMWVFHPSVVWHIKGKAPAHADPHLYHYSSAQSHSHTHTVLPWGNVSAECVVATSVCKLDLIILCLSNNISSNHPSSCGLLAHNFSSRQRWYTLLILKPTGLQSVSCPNSPEDVQYNKTLYGLYI